MIEITRPCRVTQSQGVGLLLWCTACIEPNNLPQIVSKNLRHNFMSVNKPTIQKHYIKLKTDRHGYELEMTVYNYMIEKLIDRFDVLWTS